MHFIAVRPEHEAALARSEAAFQAAGETTVPAFFQRADWTLTGTIEHFDAWAAGTPMGWEGSPSPEPLCRVRRSS